VKAEKAVDPAHDSRREELQRLTLDKGLKPLCRDYGLKATGTKSVLVDRILEHEFAPGGKAARVAREATREAVRDASSDLVTAIQSLLASGGGGAATASDVAVTPGDVTAFLQLFARTVEKLYPAQERLPAGSALEDVPLARRAARCVLDPQRGTLRVMALLVDEAGEVQASRDDTAPFVSAVLGPKGKQSRFGRELCAAFADARRAVARQAKVAQMVDAVGTVLDAEVVRTTPKGWRMLLLPDRLPALLHSNEEDRTDELAPGMVLPVVIMPTQSPFPDDRTMDRSQQPMDGGRDDQAPRAVRVSRRDASLALGLITRVCPDLASGSVRVVASQRVPGRITKIAVVNADPQDPRNPRARVLGDNYSAFETARQQLHPPQGRESFHVIDATNAEEDPTGFVAAALWPGRIGRVVLGTGPSGSDGIVYVATDDDMAKAIGKGGGNLAAATWLCRKVLGDASPRNMVVKSPAEAEEDGVTLVAGAHRKPVGKPPSRQGPLDGWGSPDFGGDDEGNGRSVGSWDDILSGLAGDDLDGISGAPAMGFRESAPPPKASSRSRSPKPKSSGPAARPAKQPSQASDEALLAQLGLPDDELFNLWSGLDEGDDGPDIPTMPARGKGRKGAQLDAASADGGVFDTLDE